VPGDRGEKAERRVARELVGDYHESELARLLEHVRDGFARYDAGELDAFELDDLIHRYKRSGRELWKFCAVSGGHAVGVARTIEDVRRVRSPPGRRVIAGTGLGERRDAVDAYAASGSGSARSAGRTSDAPAAAARQPTMTASDTHVGMCHASLSSIFVPTKARMTASP
jgi:hypothetical protein